MGLSKEQYISAYKRGFQRTILFLGSRGAPRGDAEDAAQAAWVKGWEKRDGLRKPEKILSWINTIALNVLRSQYRTSNRMMPMPEMEIGVSAPSMTSRIDLDKSFRTCSRTERNMLKDYFAGYSSKEIAQRWRLKPTAVRVRVHRAKQKVRDFIGYQNSDLAPTS